MACVASQPFQPVHIRQLKPLPSRLHSNKKNVKPYKPLKRRKMREVMNNEYAFARALMWRGILSVDNPEVVALDYVECTSRRIVACQARHGWRLCAADCMKIAWLATETQLIYYSDPGGRSRARWGCQGLRSLKAEPSTIATPTGVLKRNNESGS